MSYADLIFWFVIVLGAAALVFGLLVLVPAWAQWLEGRREYQKITSYLSRRK
jgi:hypothetical protein